MNSPKWEKLMASKVISFQHCDYAVFLNTKHIMNMASFPLILAKFKKYFTIIIKIRLISFINVRINTTHRKRVTFLGINGFVGRRCGQKWINCDWENMANCLVNRWHPLQIPSQGTPSSIKSNAMKKGFKKWILINGFCGARGGSRTC